MFTQCPQCHTAFRVTAGMLKAAQGRVRCGRCAHVFNALTFLIEPDDAAAGARPPSAPAGPPAAAPADDSREPDDAPGGEIEAEEIEIEGEVIELEGDAVELDSGDIPESALEFTADDLSKVFVLQTAPTIPRRAPVSDEDTAEHEILDIELEAPPGDETIDPAADVTEVITLEGDSVVLEEQDPSVSGAWFVAEDTPGTNAPTSAPEPAPAPPERRSPAPSDRRSGGDRRRLDDASDLSFGSVAKQAARSTEAIDEEVQREIEAAFMSDPSTRAEFTLPSGRRLEIGRPANAPAGAEADSEEAEPHDTLHAQRVQHRRAMLAWAGASAFLALTLVMQLVHHNRQSLVRNSVLGPALAGLYGAFGTELSPEWNVSAYELRQFGAAADADAQGTLRVRASLLNGAVHAQPYPVLRLTLQDRFGGRVGLRDLQPGEYLRSTPARNALIGAGQRIDADIAIVDPGTDAVGFEIDVCLPASQQGLTCANDARNSG